MLKIEKYFERKVRKDFFIKNENIFKFANALSSTKENYIFKHKFVIPQET